MEIIHLHNKIYTKSWQLVYQIRYLDLHLVPMQVPVSKHTRGAK